MTQSPPPPWTPLPIEVVEYDSRWPAVFAELRERVATALGSLVLVIEHVGSTSVPGLAAKPTIDIDAIIRSRDDLPTSIARLAAIGYVHRGELTHGPRGCDAFIRPHDSPEHHLYVGPHGSQAMRDHRALRDYLRTHPDAAAEYAALKRELAHRFPTDIAAYTKSKTEFVETVLQRALAPE